MIAFQSTIRGSKAENFTPFAQGDPTMQTDPINAKEASCNKETVVRFMSLMDSHEFDSLHEVLAPNLQLHLGSATLDRSQTEAMIRMFFDAFPDFTHGVEEVFSVGDRVALRTTDRATHNGIFQGIAPTGKRVSFGQIGIYRMVDGKIAEIWEEADLLGLMQQLGATVAPA
jgi:predicted ester cyclase